MSSQNQNLNSYGSSPHLHFGASGSPPDNSFHEPSTISEPSNIERRPSPGPGSSVSQVTPYGTGQTSTEQQYPQGRLSVQGDPKGGHGRRRSSSGRFYAENRPYDSHNETDHSRISNGSPPSHQQQHQSQPDPPGPVSPVQSPPSQQEGQQMHSHGAPLPPPYQQQPPQGHFAQAGPAPPPNGPQGPIHPQGQTHSQGYFVPGPQGGQANHFIPLIPLTDVRETPALVECPCKRLAEVTSSGKVRLPLDVQNKLYGSNNPNAPENKKKAKMEAKQEKKNKKKQGQNPPQHAQAPQQQQQLQPQQPQQLQHPQSPPAQQSNPPSEIPMAASPPSQNRQALEGEGGPGQGPHYAEVAGVPMVELSSHDNQNPSVPGAVEMPGSTQYSEDQSKATSPALRR
ncbi:MAG: hypothetical protein M1831_003483 [Alyxoria varia]|nr:MAG: hypothetical protein M1831_003483 [Alyxoria varia]